VYLIRFYIMTLVAIIVPIVAVCTVPLLSKIGDVANFKAMGFFRDIARVKARNRRMNKNAVISIGDIRHIIVDKEIDPLQEVVDQMMMNVSLTATDDDESNLMYNLPYYTREELYENGNGGNELILLSFFGRVYDVTSGAKHYGQGSKYEKFAGRDVTRALSTGCLLETCIGSKDSSNNSNESFELNDKNVKEGKKWISFFELHDSYSHVGYLKDHTPIDDMIDKILKHEDQLESAKEPREAITS